MGNKKGGTNKGRRIRFAVGRFAAMLIEEARIVGEFTYEQLDDAFGFERDRCKSYMMFFDGKKKSRAPQADEIQDLENKVASLLKRSAHRVDLENLALLSADDPHAEIVIGSPDLGMNLREFRSTDFALVYEDDWPTYRRLTSARGRGPNGETLVEVYSWQWGILWDRGALPHPWTREMQGFPDDVPIENLLPILVAKCKAIRLRDDVELAGNLPMTGGARE